MDKIPEELTDAGDTLNDNVFSIQLFNEPEITVETVGSNQTDSYGSKSDGSGKTTITNRSVKKRVLVTKGWLILLSRTQAEPGRPVRQELEQWQEVSVDQ